MKAWKVMYRTRGYRWESPRAIIVNADTKSEARREAIMRVGDMYCVVSVERYQ